MGAGIENVPPFIGAQLSHLLSHSRLPLKIDQMWSSDKYNSGLIDRFTLLIPYCLDFIKWDVIFDAESPTTVPDVIFGPEDEHFHPFHMLPSVEPNTNSSLLSDWNYKDPARLLNLIQFLRDQYVLYQGKRIGEVDDDRLKFEVSTIVSREGLEMHMCSFADKSEEVKFAVPLLDMNINKMVSGCPWRQLQKIYLQVVYPVGRKYMSASSAPRLKLVSSSELKALYSVDDVKLPSWLDGMCLAEYLPNLEEYLEKQVLEAVSLIDVRRHFIEALAGPLGRPVEADPVFCRKATFLSASGVFTFLLEHMVSASDASVLLIQQLASVNKPLVTKVHFLIPSQFPKQQPAIMLQSSQHFNSQMAPIKSRPMSDYPWSPRWEPSLMAERIFEFLADEALIFKRQCSEGQVQL